MPEIDVPFARGEDASRVSALEQFQRDLSERGIKNWGKITDSAVEQAQQSVLDTMHAQKERVLERAQTLIQDALEGKRYSGRAEFVAEMRKVLGFPTQGNFGEKGNLNNLAGDRRLRMIYDMQMTRAHAEIKAQEDKESGADVLFPAQELVRGASVKEPRDWIARWQDAGGTFYDGRMIALKDDGIWTRISAFGEPYPPFDYNSQMVVQDISIREAIDVGLLPESALDDALRDYEEINADEEPEIELPDAEPLAPATSGSFGSEYPENPLSEKDFTPEEKADGSPRYDSWLESKSLEAAATTPLGKAFSELGMLDAVSYTENGVRQSCAYVKPSVWREQTVFPVTEVNGKQASAINEAYRARDGVARGYGTNCFCCGAGFEAYCRGAKVVAKSELALRKAGDWGAFSPCFFESVNIPVVRLPVADKVFAVPTMERGVLHSLSANDAENFLRYVYQNDLPAGRYLLGYYRETGYSHLLTCEILPDKTLRFFDPQSGSVWDAMRTLPFSVLNEIPASDLVKPVQLFRMDDLPMNFEALSKLVTAR